MAVKTQQKLKAGSSKQDLTSRLERTLNRRLIQQANKNIPLVYRDKRCVEKNHFIHEYPDGRKFLIRQNLQNSEETILRQL